MAVNPNIKKKADDIRNKVYGKEVRESLASGLEEMSTDVVENTGRQDNVENQFQNLIENTTDKDVISAPEIIAARNGEANLKTRIDKDHQEVTTQLAQTNRLKVGGGVKLEPEDASQRTLDLWNGGTVEINSIPQDYSVTPIKTDYMNAREVELIKVDGAYVGRNGNYGYSTSFAHSQEIIMHQGEEIVVDAVGHLTNVSIISDWTQGGESGIPLVVSTDDNRAVFRFTSDTDNRKVRISWRKTVEPSVYIYKKIQTEYYDVKEKVDNFLKRDIELNKGSYVGTNGTVYQHTNTAFVYSEMFTVLKGNTIKITDVINTNNISIVSRYSKDGIYRDSPIKSVTNNRQSFEYTATDVVEYVKVSYHNGGGNHLEVSTITLESVMNSLNEVTEKEDVINPVTEDVDFLKYLISNVTIVGDSLMDGGYYGEGYTGEAIKESPPYFLEKLTDWNITDLSINGTSPKAWWIRYAETSDFASSDAVIMGLGTNNGLTDTLEEDVDLTNQIFADTQTGQYARIVNAFREGNPDTHIFLIDLYASSGSVPISNKVIGEIATMFDCKIISESALYGDPIMHYKNGVHYGKVGNLHKAKLLLNQILVSVSENLGAYETIIDV